MPALREFQKGFINDLYGDKHLEGSRQIHKNNVQLILRDLLKDTFPVTTRLVGEEFMHYAAHCFINAQPPQSGDMNEYGQSFSLFLKHFKPVGKFPWLPDVARLEWLMHESYLSPRKNPLQASHLEAADPLSMNLQLQPHLRLLRSGWPVDKLWHEVTEQNDVTKDFNFSPQETFVAIYRADKKVALWSLPEGGYKFLENLATTPSLVKAAEAALTADPDLRLEIFLAESVQAELFAAI